MTSPATFFSTCSKCCKANVCSVLRAIAPLLGNWEDDARPFEPDELASLCKEFFPQATIDALTEEVPAL